MHLPLLSHKNPSQTLTGFLDTTHLIQSHTNTLGLPLIINRVCLRVSIHKETPHEKTTVTENQEHS